MFDGYSVAERLGVFKRLMLLFRSTFLSVFNTVDSLRGLFNALFNSSLYLNTFLLMVNTLTVALSGFVFWLVATKFYSTEEIGLGSALISAQRLLAFIGSLGLGFGLIRFLQKAPNQVRLLNSSLSITFLASCLASTVFILGLSFWSPELLFLRQSAVLVIVFVVFTGVEGLATNLLRTFIALRRVSFAVMNSLIYSLRIVLVTPVLYLAGSFGIFTAGGLAQTAALLTSLVLFMPRLLPNYFPLPSFQRDVTNEILHFSFANFVSELLYSLPAWILPLMVINMLGGEANAYFYITWTMAALVQGIPMMTSLSFLAENSFEEKRISVSLQNSLKLVAFLLTPAIIIVWFFGDKVMLIFGEDYSTAGLNLLRVLTLSAIPISINFLYIGLARVEKKLWQIFAIGAAIAFGTLILGFLLVPRLGIMGTGIAWLGTQSLVMFAVLPTFLSRLRQS